MFTNALRSILFERRIDGFGYAVGVEKNSASGQHLNLVLRKLALHYSKRQAGVELQESRAPGIYKHRRKMTGACERQLSLWRIQDRIHERNKLIGRKVLHQELVELKQHIFRRKPARGMHSQNAARRRHQKRGSHALPGNVSQHNREATIAQGDVVIPIAAHLAARYADAAQIKACGFGRARWKESRLNSTSFF